MIRKEVIEISGDRISCRIRTGKGPVIVFLHGNSLSSESFLGQFFSGLLEPFGMIAIDFPGHGESGAYASPAEKYHLFHIRDLLISVLEHFGIHSFVLAGHSLGGHAAMESLPLQMGCQGLIIWGAPPIQLPLDLGAVFTSHPSVGLLFKPDLTEDEKDNLAALLSEVSHRKEVLQMINASDPAFRAHFPASFAKGMLSDEYSLVRSSGLPVAILHGEYDAMVKLPYYNTLEIPLLWTGKPIIISDSSHSPQLENPGEFNRILLSFIDSLQLSK